MHKSIQQYLNHYAEPNLPASPAQGQHTYQWQWAVCIPCFNESSAFIKALPKTANILIILVVNHPRGRDSGLNISLVESLSCEHPSLELGHHDRLITLEGDNRHILLVDRSTNQTGFNPKHGVGLARKLAADIALKWHVHGLIQSDWIAMTDADALLPETYFEALPRPEIDTPAVVYPFSHSQAGTPEEQLALALYELKLHHYVAGLLHAKSPYAHHSIGSCMAMRAKAYAQVRGIPKRAAGEDFYLLNKANKLGKIRTLGLESTIMLSPRRSDRTPFGTGQGVNTLSDEATPLKTQVFYPPKVFESLKGFLANVASGAQTFDAVTAALPEEAKTALKTLGLESALIHCKTHGPTPQKFQRQLHLWFDGFRTLKYIHQLAPPRTGLLSFDEWSVQSGNADLSPSEASQHLRALCYQNLIDD